ncbi:MAG TPA: sulfite exporter TauE/SafE family protein [Leptolyngbyaceae cyanobacterium]
MTPELMTWLLLFLFGIITGLIAAIFGMGGGLITVPFLTFWGVPIVEAAATSLVGAFLSAVSGSLQNWRTKQINWRIALQLGLFGIFTAQLGAALGDIIPEIWLSWSFAIFLLLQIYLINLRQKVSIEELEEKESQSNYPEETDNSINNKNIWDIATIGALAGIISGLFGLSGGTVMVPLQLIFWMEPIKVAVRTSLGAMIPITISGISQYAWQGHVLWIPGLCLGLGNILGAQIGSRWLTHLPEKIVNLLFRLILLSLAIYMFGKAAI